MLLNDRSRRIAANLGLKQPAHEAKICVDCHGHNPPADRRGERFKASDGISCEACHGPAEHWIKSHVAPGATHEENVRNGLYPTEDPVALARLCLSCHFGNKDKFVTHRIMGAGHPRISFELDTFTQTQPPHFVVDEDWRKRKGRWDGVRVWAIGQALAAQESLDVRARPEARPRRPVPGAGRLRLPRLPPPDVRHALEAARGDAARAPSGSTTRTS